MQLSDIENFLRPYLPPAAVTPCAQLVLEHRFSLTVTPERHSKLGDYRPPHNGKGHRISLNGTMNPYQFLLTFLHELAHLVVWKNHGRKAQVHGIEWQYYFDQLARPFLTTEFFPHELLHQVTLYLISPSASSQSHQGLDKAMKKYDKPEPAHSDRVSIEEISEGACFELQGRIFKRGPLLRAYFACEEVSTGRRFRVRNHQLVTPVALSTLDETSAKAQPAAQLRAYDVPEGSVFQVEGSDRLFVKVQNRRTNCLCIDLANKREYLVHGHLPVRIREEG